MTNCPNLCSIEILNDDDDESEIDLNFKFIQNASVVSLPNTNNVVIEYNQYEDEGDLIVFVAHHVYIDFIEY